MKRLQDSLRREGNQPLDAKYYNASGNSYSSIDEVLSEIPIEDRYIGLTVNINGAEYWFISPNELVIKATSLGSLTNVSDDADGTDSQPQELYKEGPTWKTRLQDYIRRSVCDSNGLPIETASQYLSRVGTQFRYVGLSIVLLKDTKYCRYEFVGGITDDKFMAMEYANDFNGGTDRAASAEVVKILHDMVTNIDSGTY